MTRHAIVCVLMATLLMASASASLAEVDGEEALPISIGPPWGNVWTKDLRITRNSAEDTMPQIVIDASRNSHIIWQRSGYWTKTIDRTGQALSKEVFITPHVVRGYGSAERYPLGPTVAIDSRANIHVTWDDGWQNVYYQKFDPEGNTMTDVIHVGNVDNTASHVPAIAIDPINDYVHIVHEDYEYQCEDIVYDKLDNDGKILVNEVSISNDVSSHCEHCTLTTDQLGYIHVAFGSSTGAWWRKVDQNGVARGHSVNMLSVPSYMITDLACTPNGDVHMVWAAEDHILYTRLDNNGTKLDEDVVVSKNGVSPGAPRIAASDEKNTVYIVWHDNRDGNSEIYYAKMEEGKYNETPENYRLTRNPAASLYPRIDVSPKDDVHVVWSDTRDGNSEIYYKFMFHFDMELGVINYPRFFFHPNETKTLHMTLENQGVLPDDYRVTISYDDWAETKGWVLVLNATEFNRVPGGSKVYFNLTMTSPPLANAGDYINVTINATSLSDKDVDESLSWRSFIIVEKSVTVVCAQPTKLIAPGGDVLFNLTIRNNGDVPDTYGIDHTLIPDNAGWRAVQDVVRVTLDVDETMNLSLILSAPENAKANDNGTVFVRVQSTTDASVWDGKKLMAIVDPTFHLEMEALVPTKWVDPGGSVDFSITVRNVGNMQGKVTIFVTSTNPRPGWSAYLSNETVLLAGGEEQVITLTVTAPANALAGLRQVIRVNVVSEDYYSRGEVEVSALVNKVYGLYPSIRDLGFPIHAGETAEYLLTVENVGNGMENVGLDAAMVPQGWVVTFEYLDVKARSIVLLSRDFGTVTVLVSTSIDTLAGDYRPKIVLQDGAGQEYIIPILTRVYQRYALDLAVSDYQGVGPPKSTVSYSLSLLNEGNGEDTFVLEHDGLPSASWTARFLDWYGNPITFVTLAAGERGDIELRVYIPEDADATEPVYLYVRATSTSAEEDEVKLMLDVKLPDLKILSVEYDPATTTGMEPTLVTIRVSNEGSFPAENVNVVMLKDGKELSREVVKELNEGSTASVTFQWTPTPGKHTLTFRVSSDVPESDYDNNELTHIRTVDGGPSAQQGTGVWAVLLVLVSIVVTLFIYRERISRRE